jgi:hypothetical protein
MNGIIKIRTKGAKGEKVTEIVGFHSKRNLGKSSCQVRMANDGEEKQLQMQYYEAQISSLDGKVTKMSTFYPKSWTEDDIKEAVITAFMNKVQSVGTCTAEKGNGMPILFMGTEADGTAFPFFG